MKLDDFIALSSRVVGAAIEVHRTLGPGLLESAYQACLLYELSKRDIGAEAQVALPVVYDQQKLTDVGYRIDILVEGALILELKSVEVVSPLHKAQLLSYLRLSNLRLGLLLNFNVMEWRDGITRLINGY